MLSEKDGCVGKKSNWSLEKKQFIYFGKWTISFAVLHLVGEEFMTRSTAQEIGHFL